MTGFMAPWNQLPLEFMVHEFQAGCENFEVIGPPITYCVYFVMLLFILDEYVIHQCNTFVYELIYMHTRVYVCVLLSVGVST